jgi:hyperosmotically inducible protein
VEVYGSGSEGFFAARLPTKPYPYGMDASDVRASTEVYEAWWYVAVVVSILWVVVLGVRQLRAHRQTRSRKSHPLDDSSKRRPTSVRNADQTVAAKVKTAINVDSLLKGTNIQITSQRGIVNLKGTVESEQLRKRAVQAARRVQGVVRISDEIIVEHS